MKRARALRVCAKNCTFVSMVTNCLKPFQGYRYAGINPKTGKHYGILKKEDLVKNTGRELEEVVLRCGKCINCLKYKGSVLVARCVAESRMHDENAFITLTVSDDKLSEVFPGDSLSHRPFQLFCKRLRKKLGADIKYIMCGEYGELSARPHYHAIVFGVAPFIYINSHVLRPDGLGFLKNREDNPVFQDAWPFGDVFCGSVTSSSIAYVSGYTLKQYILGRDKKWYKDRHISPEYVKWSRRPGLGRSYFEKYDLLDFHDGYVDCGVSVDDRRVFPGRYYLDWLRLTSPENYDMLLSSYETGELQQETIDAMLRERDRKAEVARYRVMRQKRM